MTLLSLGLRAVPRRGRNIIDLLPDWTKTGSWTLGRDPLGLQATSVRIYRALVPGLTNVTNRLRYYSFYCWVIDRYEAVEHADDQARWRAFIRRAEALYALACNVADGERADGLAGNIWARRLLTEGALPETVDVQAPTGFGPGVRQYLSARRGNFGQFYIASMIEEGFLEPTSGIPLVSRTLGREAARTFAASIGPAAEALLAGIQSGAIRRDDLLQVGQVIHPSAIPAGSAEMTLLRDFLLGRHNPPAQTPRRVTCWLVLDLMLRGVAIDDDRALRHAFYERKLPDGSDYQPGGGVIDTWRAYQANEYAHIALELVLNAMMGRLEARPGGEDPDALVADTLAPAMASLPSAGTWSDWAAMHGSAHVGQESHLAEHLLAALRQETLPIATETVAAALTLLAALWARWADGQGDVIGVIERHAGSGSRSLAGVIRTLRAQAARPPAAALAVLIRRHIIADHLAIAGRKLAAAGTFTYHFTSADGVLADGRVAPYGYTNPRLQNVVRFLRDAGLHDGASLTPDGTSFVHADKPV